MNSFSGVGDPGGKKTLVTAGGITDPGYNGPD
jgi:hypothetical protein